MPTVTGMIVGAILLALLLPWLKVFGSSTPWWRVTRLLLMVLGLLLYAVLALRPSPN
jgi:ABC-type branched-subunit amino acid transport system permease subunit